MIRTSVSARILARILVVIVPFSLVSISIAWKTSNDILLADRTTSEKRLVYLGAKNLETYFSQVNSELLSPYLANNFVANLGKKSLDYAGTTQNERTLMSLLVSRPEFEYLYFYNVRSQTLFSMSKQTSAYHAFPEGGSQDWISDALMSHDGLALEPPGLFVNLKGIGVVSDNRVFVMSRRIFDIETNEPLAVLALAVSAQRMLGVLDTIRSGNETLGLYDGTRTFFSDTGDPAMQQGLVSFARQASSVPEQVEQVVRTISGKTYLMSKVLLFHGLRLVKAVPFSLILASASTTLGVNLVFLIVLALALPLIVYVTVFRLLSPLKKLAGAMERVGAGDLAVEPPGPNEVSRRDEIGVLSRGFHTMVASLDRHIDEEFKARIQTQEAQLRALQTQINPHFIFNTLQAMGALALRHKANDLYDVSTNLAAILRYSLRPTTTPSTVGEEILNLRKYMEIQILRFGERLTMEWDLDDTLTGTIIPGLILQPIVENAIVHNLEASRRNLRLTVTTERGPQKSLISVHDDGLGVNQEKLAALQNELGGPSILEADQHIGLPNVAERLRIFFSGEARLELHSARESGTTVNLWLPWRQSDA